MAYYMIEVCGATRNKPGRKNQDNLMIDKFVSCTTRLDGFACGLTTDNTIKRVFAVSDGIGGSQGGDMASEIALRALADKWDNVSELDTKEAVSLLTDCANERVVQYFEENGGAGGATLSGVIVDGDFLYLFNIGDSPIYLYREKRLEQISAEHTLAAEKNITASKKNNSDANTLTRYVGNRSEFGSVMAYVSEFEIHDGDVLLICSDGIIKGLKQKEIERRLASKDGNVAEKLVGNAYKKRAGDDITAVVIKFNVG